MLSQNQIALLINTFSQLTTNTNYVTTTRINASYKTTQSFNYEGNTVKPLLDIYSGNQVVILKDTSTGKYYAIREDFDPVLNERTFTRKYREERKKVSKQEADVAVLLCCEKNDTYEFWVTWLGNRRKNRFAYVGELPKRLQTEQYWAWESNSGGRFEFHPYAGATGGGISISTTPNNYDGAIVGAGPQGADYESIGFNGGGDIGGVVTPRWDRVLTDYTVTARTSLRTLYYPLSVYSDVSWKWSDQEGDGPFFGEWPNQTYQFKKVGGGGARVSSSGDKVGTSWEVTWEYEGGGGGVTVAQENPPTIVNTGEEVTIDTYEWGNGESYTGPNLTFTVTENTVPTYFDIYINGDYYWARLYGSSISAELTNVQVEVGTEARGRCSSRDGWFYYFPIDAVSVSFGGGHFCEGYGDSESRTTYGKNTVHLLNGTSYVNDVTHNPNSRSGWWLNWRPYREFTTISTDLGWTTTHVSKQYAYGPRNYKRPDDPVNLEPTQIDTNKATWRGNGSYDFELYSQGKLVLSKNYGEDPTPELTNSEPIGSYEIIVFNEDGLEVATDSASTPITHNLEKIETWDLNILIKNKKGEEAGGESRRVTIKEGESLPTGSGEVNDVEAGIEAWVEVNDAKLSVSKLDGSVGQAIRESSEYQEATKPYKDSRGRTVYPYYPQKSEPLQKEETVAFSLDDGFYAYHVTNYVTKDKAGLVAEWTPFDFNNPGLSGQLPSPAVNYLYSRISTDLEIEYNPKGFLSWGKDIPEEDPETGKTTNLQEETEEGVDRYGVVYPLVFGFTYALYGPIKVSNILLSQLVDKDNDETLLSKYKKQYWEARARSRKPRLYALAPDNYKDGQPFEEFDYSDINQRGLHKLEGTMSRGFRMSLWGYTLSPIGNEGNEDWAEERVTFAANPSGGDTPFERQYLNDETANSSTVKQPGDKTVDITVKMADVEALLKKDKKGEVEFTIHDSQQSSKTTTQVFKMNPIRDVFEGYEDVKILAVAGVIY